MRWDLSAECVSLVVLCIIWIYSRQGDPLPSLKNKLFQLCFLITFCSMASNVIATILLYHYRTVPLFLCRLFNTIYFIATPLMGTAYFFYTLAVVYENQVLRHRTMLLLGTPALLYLVLLFFNPLTGAIFTVDAQTGYHRGAYLRLTYLLFYLYCIACVVMVFRRRRSVEVAVRRILLLFPLIALLVVAMEQIFPRYMLTGSAATCALLLLYLYLQNKQISIDFLTGIPNRQEFLRMLDLRLRAQNESPFTVLILSLKGFKHANDKFGQQNGDLFLRGICSFLVGITRGQHIYRFSGDEFAILIKENESSILHEIAGKIHARMQQPWVVSHYSWIFAFAFAVVKYPDSAKTKDGLINGIELAVAKAKTDGPGYCYCTPELLAQVSRRNSIYELLRERVTNGTLEVYYQPILQVDTKRFSAAESLLRMRDTPYGDISPNEFIPIAEDTGLIVEITYFVLRRACAFVRDLLAAGVEVDAINVNFSGRQFAQENSAEAVLAILLDSGIPPAAIKIEITESVLMYNLVEVRRFMARLGAVGVRFAVDDFGTGYSNVALIGNVIFHTIKIDKSLIWSSITSERMATIVRHLAPAFRCLDMDVLAEGIETLAQRDFALECGANFIQGFLYARPMPAGDAARLMGTRYTPPGESQSTAAQSLES